MINFQLLGTEKSTINEPESIKFEIFFFGQLYDKTGSVAPHKNADGSAKKLEQDKSYR